jgi:hypothetical protein
MVFLIQALGPMGRAEALDAPSDLTAWYNVTYVQLSWEVESDESIVGYTIYRSGTPGGPWEQLNTSPFPETVFVDYTPPSDEVTYYKIAAVAADGSEGPHSAPAEVDTGLRTRDLPLGAPLYRFDKNNIISDPQLRNYKAMTQKEIQDFLASKKSVLATYKVKDKTAAQHIYEACKKHKINPQVILVTLQKEQLLITSSKASQKRLKWAMGWGKRSTFAEQIEKGTRQFRLYYERLSRYQDAGKKAWSVGEPHKVFDGTVTPASMATAGLYIYTPWIGQGGGGRRGVGGNYLFWDMWYNTFRFGGDGITPVAQLGMHEGRSDKGFLDYALQVGVVLLAVALVVNSLAGE